jgi:hypothetical protein
MHKSLNIIIGNQELTIIKISDACMQEQLVINNLDDIENKLQEIIQSCNYDIKVIIDSSEQSFTSDILLSITEQSFLHSIRAKNDQTYNETNLTGYFIVGHQNNNHIENKIITISVPKNNLINAVLSKIKIHNNTIKSITSMTAELQQLCIELKREYVTIHYDQSEASIRAFAEYDIYVMLTSAGIVRYIIFKNDIYFSNSYTILDKHLEEEKLLETININLDNLLRKLDPSINDQLNMFICLNKNQLNSFTEIASKVDRLILVEVDKLAKNLNLTLQGENNSTIDPILAFFLDHHNPIATILDLEYNKIIRLENYNRLLRWPTLFISCALILSILIGLLTDRYYENKLSQISSQVNNTSEQIRTAQRQQDLFLSQGNLNQIFKIYQEVASYQTPFTLFKDLIKIKTNNLDYIDIFWTNSNNENVTGSIYNNVTIIANIKTDSNNSFDTVINNFISSLTSQNTSYIVDYSRPTDQIINIGNGDNNPLIIKIRCVSKK